MVKRVFQDHEWETGLVFAGFGEKEIFPTLLEYRLDGVIDNKIRGELNSEEDIDRNEHPALIQPFAQSEMVQRFMEDVDNQYQSYINQLFLNVLMDFSLSVLQKVVPNASDEELKKMLENLNTPLVKSLEEFKSLSKNFRMLHFARPVIQMVTVLPKEELAHMAEALISLTSMKRRVSAEMETVGGPVDVALISKEDGFIWVKRKHYFDQELNPYFISNYFNKYQEGKNE